MELGDVRMMHQKRSDWNDRFSLIVTQMCYPIARVGGSTSAKFRFMTSDSCLLSQSTVFRSVLAILSRIVALGLLLAKLDNRDIALWDADSVDAVGHLPGVS